MIVPGSKYRISPLPFVILQPSRLIDEVPLLWISIHLPSGKLPVVLVEGRYSVMIRSLAIVGRVLIWPMLVAFTVG